MGKEVVDAAVKVFGAHLMKEKIERVVQGRPQESLGVLASWRETRMAAEPKNCLSGGRENLLQVWTGDLVSAL